VTSIGDTITVPYEQSKKLRKEGWRPRNDVVVMMYVGKPEPDPAAQERSVEHRRATQRRYRAKLKARWASADRNLAEAAQ
jgi:hypothetical protein